VPSAARRTITERPRSCGRASSQYTSAPSIKISPRPTDEATIMSEVIGEDQEPKGATCGSGITTSARGIDLVDDVADPISRKTGNFDDFGCEGCTAQFVSDGAQQLFSRHRRLNFRTDEKTGRRRPQVAGTLADCVMRFVEV